MLKESIICTEIKVQSGLIPYLDYEYDGGNINVRTKTQPIEITDENIDITNSETLEALIEGALLNEEYSGEKFSSDIESQDEISLRMLITNIHKADLCVAKSCKFGPANTIVLPSYFIMIEDKLNLSNLKIYYHNELTDKIIVFRNVNHDQVGLRRLKFKDQEKLIKLSENLFK